MLGDKKASGTVHLYFPFSRQSALTYIILSHWIFTSAKLSVSMEAACSPQITGRLAKDSALQIVLPIKITKM